MSVSCRNCRWHRDEPTPSEIVRGLNLPLVEFFAEVLREIEARLESERLHESDKVTRLRDKALARGDIKALRSAVWDKKPFASAYCGRDSNVSGMRELINLFGDCPTHFPGMKVSRTCTMCRHLQPPDTPHFSAGAGLKSEETFLRNARAMIESGVREECLRAINQLGELTSKPRHLPICQLYSQAGVYVVGPLVNSRHDCPGWANIIDNS